jgi:glyoxylase-like metal-dependent hydrolase (beta-lactamase superfamily II)
MDDIKIPEEQIVSMDAVAEGVQGLRIVFVNVYAITCPDDSWMLIDAGLPFSEGAIHKWAEKQFRRPPKAIILSHGHFDHVSAARQLAERWNVPIWAHSLEFPYLTGKQEYPAPNAQAGGGLMSLLAPIYPRGPIDLGSRLRPLSSFDSGPVQLTGLPDWQVLHTPGHTPGHISFFRPEDRTLLVGDAFCTTKPESFFEAAIAQPPEIHGPPAYFTSDWELARGSVQRLAKLRPAIIAPGHGKALAGSGVAESLERLAADFDRIAVPENRKTFVRGT